MATLLGNHGPYSRRTNAPQGVGAQMVGPIVGCHTQIAGKAGEVYAVSVNQVAYLPNVRLGIYMQSSAAVSIRYSLDGVETAGSEDPDVRAVATWSAAQALTAGTIVKPTPEAFVVAEITFTADAIVSFYAR